MKERELRRYCRQVLRKCNIVPPLRIEDLCEQIGNYREKPIRLIPWELPVPGPFGLWIARISDDCIIYQKHTSRVHQVHIILHEIGHILGDHMDTETLDTAPDLGKEFPSHAILGQLKRSCYEEEYERQAEMVANIIHGWASVIDYTTPPTPDSAIAPHLHKALNARLGWL